MPWLWGIVAFVVVMLGTPAAAQDREGDGQPPPIQARPGGPDTSPRTDQTIDVVKGTRLVLTNTAGEVVIRSWDRDQVRLQASHSDRERIDVQTADMTLRVRARAARGPASLVDYQVTVPRWMPVNLSGTYLEATVEGTAAEITVETVHGNVRVVGGSGTVSARSVQGEITVERAAGRVQASTVNEGIRLINVSGDMTAETTNGDIVVQDAQTSSLDASTVNGDITFNGTVRESGAYRLTTHGGDVRVGLGGAANATIFVRTFQGSFSADFPVQLPEGQTARSGSKRFNFTLGTGSARIEIQSFNGDIVLARNTVGSADELRRQRRSRPAIAPKPPMPPVVPKPPPGLRDLARLTESWPELAFDALHETSWRAVQSALDDLHFDVDFDFDIDLDLELDADGMWRRVAPAAPPPPAAAPPLPDGTIAPPRPPPTP